MYGAKSASYIKLGFERHDAKWMRRDTRIVDECVYCGDLIEVPWHAGEWKLVPR